MHPLLPHSCWQLFQATQTEITNMPIPTVPALQRVMLIIFPTSKILQCVQRNANSVLQKDPYCLLLVSLQLYGTICGCYVLKYMII